MSNISLVPQAQGIGADGTDQNLMQLLAARKLAQAQGQSGGGLGKSAQPAFAPQSGRQAGLGYALVAGNALLERMEANKQAQKQSAGAEQTAAMLRRLGGQYKDITGAQVLGMAALDPGLLKQVFEAATRAPQSVSAGSSLVGNDGRAIYQAPHAPMTLGSGQRLIQPPTFGGSGASAAPTQPAPSALAVPGGPAPPAQAGGGQVLASVPENPGALRKEFQGVSDKYTGVAEVWQAMKGHAAQKDKFGDLGLVYGIAKLFDPTSVVREGEQIIVRNAASLPQWLLGHIEALNGKGQLTDETRTNLMQVGWDRVKPVQGNYEQQRGMFQADAQQQGIDPNMVMPAYEPARPYIEGAHGPRGAQDQMMGSVGEAVQMPLPPMRPQEMGQSPAGPMSAPAPMPQQPMAQPPQAGPTMEQIEAEIVRRQQMQQNQGAPGSELRGY